jgi:hemerythrin superfamily protein
MATKTKTRASRDAEHKSNRSRAAAGRSRAHAPSGDALEVLEHDHREVEEWFDEYDEMKGKEDGKEQLAEKICLALKVHAQIEEEIFYPRAREATKDNDLVDEAIIDHATLKVMIGEIEEMDVGDELYDAKIRELSEMVKRHITEEEEELFPELQSSKMDLKTIGKKLAERKEELRSEMQT